MRHLVVFTHPLPGSFIRQAAGAYVDELERGLCGVRVVEYLHFDDLGPHTTTERIDGCIARVRRAVRNHF